MIRIILPLLCALWIALLSACGPSGIAQKEMEKFSGTPTPPIKPLATEAPVDPPDAIQVDTSLDGPTLSINDYQQKRSLRCDKYNLVRINGDKNTVRVTGVCKQISVNGDGNKVTADASMEFVFNGVSNSVTYSRFANAKRPNVLDNKGGNEIEHVRGNETR